MKRCLVVAVGCLILGSSLPVEAQKGKKPNHTPSLQEYNRLALYREVDGLLQDLDVEKGHIVVRVLDEHVAAKNAHVHGHYGLSADLYVSKHSYDFDLKLKQQVILRVMWDNSGKWHTLNDLEKAKVYTGANNNPGTAAMPKDFKKNTHVRIRLMALAAGQRPIVTTVIGIDEPLTKATTPKTKNSSKK